MPYWKASLVLVMLNWVNISSDFKLTRFDYSAFVSTGSFTLTATFVPTYLISVVICNEIPLALLGLPQITVALN